MTTPDLSFIIPTKWKAGVALVGSALSFVVPFVLESADALPAPWPAVIGVVLFLLSALGVYKAPYAPTGTVLVPNPDPVVRRTVPGPTGTVLDGDINMVPGEYRNPWQ